MVSPNNDRSWTFVVLPYLDKRSVYDHFRDNAIANTYATTGNLDPNREALEFDFTVCPNFPPALLSRSATTYAANTGQLDQPASSFMPADFQGNGVFHTRVRRSPDDMLTRVSARHVFDGLGTTLLLAENADARSWMDTSQRWTGFTYHHADGMPGAPGPHPRDPLGINVWSGKSRLQTPQDQSLGYTRPSSYHPGGVFVMFCDSHVRFISDAMSYRVYQALMTPNGKEARNNSIDDRSPFPPGHAALQLVDEEQIR